MKKTDLVIVGGGIAGGALATVMATAGASVLMLERQPAYRDHVRGEILWPWGARLARQLQIEQVLLDAGALVVRWLDVYDEAASEPTREDVGSAVPAISGTLNLTHPQACAALASAAASAGADVRMGAREIEVSVGETPSVRWLDDSGEKQAAGQMVVGADGRRSSVRSQAAIPFEVDRPAHLVAGMLAEGVASQFAEVNLIAREADLQFLSFPQEGGRARMYFCFPTQQRSRFAGSSGAERFLSATKLDCLSEVIGLDGAKAAGPCATFPAEDSRAPFPIAEGVVLIGDAAGYENPLEGQGLSMALHDVHDVASALMDGSSRREALEAYALARAGRQKLANLATTLEVWANEGFVEQDPEQRAARNDFIQNDEVLTAIAGSYSTGFDVLPQDLTSDELSKRLESAPC